MHTFPFIFIPLHSSNSSIPLLYEDSLADSPHSQPYSLHSHHDSPHSHSDSPHSHHSYPDSPHSYHSHPNSPHFYPDSPHSHHFPSSVPRFPIPAQPIPAQPTDSLFSRWLLKLRFTPLNVFLRNNDVLSSFTTLLVEILRKHILQRLFLCYDAEY